MLKFIIKQVLLLLIIYKGFGQNIAVELVNNRFIEFNVKNRVQIAVEDISCESILVKTDAEIFKENNCLWIIKPIKYYHKPGLPLEIYKIVDSDTALIDVKYLMVRLLRTMTPKISQFKNLDTISIYRLSMEEGIYAVNEEWDKTGCYSNGVKRFNCLVVRDGKVIGFVTNKGSKFGKDCKHLFKKLRPND